MIPDFVCGSFVATPHHGRTPINQIFQVLTYSFSRGVELCSCISWARFGHRLLTIRNLVIKKCVFRCCRTTLLVFLFNRCGQRFTACLPCTWSSTMMFNVLNDLFYDPNRNCAYYDNNFVLGNIVTRRFTDSTVSTYLEFSRQSLSSLSTMTKSLPFTVWLLGCNVSILSTGYRMV